jgi:hypothetical protein
LVGSDFVFYSHRLAARIGRVSATLHGRLKSKLEEGLSVTLE